MEEDTIKTDDEVELIAEQLDEANFFLGNEYYYEEHQYEKAIKSYESVLENVKDDEIVRAKSLYWMGESYVKLNQIDKAIETFNQLIKEFKDHYLTSSAQRRIAHLKEIYGGQVEDE